MDLKEKIVAVLEERSFEIKDGSSKMMCIESSDFDQIAEDLLEILRQSGFDVEKQV